MAEGTLEELKGVKEVADVILIEPNHLRVYLNQAEKVMPQIMRIFLERGSSISSINITEPSLDDVFLHYTGLTIEMAQRRTLQR